MKLLEVTAGVGRSLAALGLTCVVLQLVACAGAPMATPDHLAEVDQMERTTLEANWGIKVEGLRLSAAGSMLDFRYRVLEPAKAAPLLDGKTQVFLIDEAHGAKLGVPDTPVLGRIRQTARNGNLLTDRTYFIMFGNPGKALQRGDKVTLLLGQAKVSDLMVQ
jgi:hypothetical protein